METKDTIGILFVCLGNICRSPAAEGICRSMLAGRNTKKRYFVDSAGTAGWHEGELPDKRMREHGRKRGYRFDSRARRLVPEDFDRFRYILTMDEDNYRDVCVLLPAKGDGVEVMRVADFLSGQTCKTIPDPYYSGPEAFELVLDLLENACMNLLDTLEANS